MSNSGALPARHGLSWRGSIEPWYLAYALMGTTTTGIISILLPLGMIKGGTAVHVGIVWAAVSLGELSAGPIGALADRYRRHRLLFAGGILLAALGFLGLLLPANVVLWSLCALAIGVGSAAAGTIGNLFIVEVHPKAEWDARIASLQSFYNFGSVAGLLMAAVLTRAPLNAGWLLAAGLTAAGAAIGWFLTHTPPPPTDTSAPAAAPIATSANARGVAAHLRHRLTRNSLATIGRRMRSPFGVLMLVWFISNIGTAAVYNFYPLLMQSEYAVSPDRSSVVMALATAVSAVIFSPAGRLTARVGAGRAQEGGLALRLASLAAMFVLALAAFPGRWLPTAAAFILLEVSWAPISVASTYLVSALSPKDEGEAMGVYNTVFALSGLAGSVAGGWVVEVSGYNAATVLGLATVAVSMPPALVFLRRPQAGAVPPTPA